MTQTYQAGRVLGRRYKLLTPIAQGGMGEVWKARDEVTHRVVALKVLRQELSGQDVPLNRLRTEARNAMRVEHANIAAVLDSGEQDGRGWIVMELVEGRPLSDYLGGGRRMSVPDLLPVMVQSALALQALEDAGIVHRDIKPANILVRDDGVVKLTDFGISLTSGQPTMTAAGMVMGTAQYLPPEQAMGKTATNAGDLYALGVIAYEAVAGRRPFTGPSAVDIAFSHVNDPVPALPEDVPAPFADVVMRLLAKDPAGRPASGSVLASELIKVAARLGIPANPHPLADPMAEDAAQSSATDAAPAAAAPAPPVIPPVAHTPRRRLRAEAVEDDPLAGVDQDMARIQAAGDAPIRSRYRSRPTAGEARTAAAPSSSIDDAPPTRRRSVRSQAAPDEGGWRSVETAVPVESAPVATTRFSRSQVVPPRTRREQIGMAVIAALVILTLLLIAFAVVKNRIGGLSIGEGVTITQEVQSWQMPPHIV